MSENENDRPIFHYAEDDPLTKKIEANLLKGLRAARQGKEALNKAFDEMFPQDQPTDETPEE